MTLIKQPSSNQLLARILETPNLPEQIRALPAGVLSSLIDRVGLEDAGELVAFATTEQLAGVFDEDLWRNARPGEDETFDGERFVTWLAIMREAGDAFLAEKLSELPPDLVTLAIHRQVLVLDLDAMIPEMQDDGEDTAATEKALESVLSEEIEQYRIIARRHEGWDDLVVALLALDRDHHDHLMRILERCAAMSADYVEENGGLYDVLTSDEMLETDVAGDREDRRAEAGYVAPSAAAAFLKLAKEKNAAPVVEHDSLTRAYFRNLRKTANAPAGAATAPALVPLLRDAGVVIESPRLLAASSSARVEPLFVRAMRRLAQEDPSLFAERSEEVAYLTNVLVAGCELDGRRMRPIDAVRVVIDTCSLGLEIAGKDALRTHPADGLFRLAWERFKKTSGRRFRP